jgi:hypothetical protein
MSQLKPLHQKEIENRIFTVRGVQVMIDSHLAELYDAEWEYLRLQIATSKRGGRRNINFANTKLGVSSIL